MEHPEHSEGKKKLNESRDFFRFFFRTAKKDVVFYSERSSYYAYFEGIIKELTTVHNQPIIYVTSDIKDPILKTENKMINPFYLDKLLPLFFRFVNCKVFVMTLTDLNQFHLKRSIHKVHYVYVFHSLASTHMIYRKGSFDHYDSILCVGEQHKQEIRKYEEINNLPKKQLVNAGFSRLELLYEQNKRYKKQKSDKKVVLIAPSWGESNIIELCGEKIIKKLLENGYEVILRPHSEIIKRNPQMLEQIKNKFKDDDFSIVLDSYSNEPLLKSDILLTDYSGIALSYAFGTGRPVLFIDVPPKVKNPDYEMLGIAPLEMGLRNQIGSALNPDDIDSLPSEINRLIRNSSYYESNSKKLRDRYIYNFGKSSEIGAKHIMDILSKKGVKS
jgi:YidC/Oxa1 family membrane protein insertase